VLKFDHLQRDPELLPYPHPGIMRHSHIRYNADSSYDRRTTTSDSGRYPERRSY
jgi:hypothetical protein